MYEQIVPGAFGDCRKMGRFEVIILVELSDSTMEVMRLIDGLLTLRGYHDCNPSIEMLLVKSSIATGAQQDTQFFQRKMRRSLQCLPPVIMKWKPRRLCPYIPGVLILKLLVFSKVGNGNMI